MDKIAIRIPLPPRVKGFIETQNHLWGDGSCLILSYDWESYPLLINELEKAIEAIRRGPLAHK